MKPNICVLGAGPGGYTAAVRASQLGGQVTLIEAENPGGTCLNWGCIPSKVMITTAELLDRFRQANTYGIEVHGDIRIRMDLLMARKEKIIRDQTLGLRKLFDRHRIRYISGRGRVDGHGMTTVETPDGSTEPVPWDHLILATGTRPLELPGMAFDGQRVLSSNHALSMTEVPRTIAILGGGVVGCEFASLLSALGTDVTVIEAMPRLLPLPSVDESVSKVLQREFKKRRIKMLVNRTVTEVDTAGEGVGVVTGPSPFLENPGDRDQRPTRIEVDRLLVCVGRRPNSSGIGLESVGVETDEKGWIIADDTLKAGRRGVWAVGDILGPARIMLAHAAATEGGIAAENIMGASKAMTYETVPGAIFTHPEVATVGLTRTQVDARGIPARWDTVLFRTVPKSQISGDIAGEISIVSHDPMGTVLGVHMIGPQVTELIAQATLAVQQGLTVTHLADTIHAHPTLSEIIHETALKALGRPLHG